jgi:hypothetical protein
MGFNAHYLQPPPFPPPPFGIPPLGFFPLPFPFAMRFSPPHYFLQYNSLYKYKMLIKKHKPTQHYKI